MSSSPVYLLKLLGSGVLEKSVVDIFTDEYVRTFYNQPGKYKVQCRRFYDGYTTLQTVRYVELDEQVAPPEPVRAYAAPDDEDGGIVEPGEGVPAFDSSATPPVSTSIDVSPAEFKMVQAPGGNYNIVDQKGNVIYGGFNLNDLQKAKEATGGKGPVNEKDLTNKKLMEYVLVFLAGTAFGGVSVFMYMDHRYKQDMDKMNGELQTMRATLEEVQVKQKQQRKGISLADFDDFDPFK